MLNGNDFKEKQIVFVNMRDGDKLSYQNDNIVVKDDKGKIKHQSSCHQLFALYIIGNYTITSVLIEKSRKMGFSIILMSYSFRVNQILNNGLIGNYLLRRKQYYSNELEIGKKLVLNKIMNQRKGIMNIRKKSEDIKKTISNLEYYSEILVNQKELDLSTLMAFEGLSSKQYFKIIFSELDWQGRQPRIKRDCINVVLDMGYSLLFSYIESLLSLYDFDIYVGVLHRQFYKRKSLVCDIIEPFRYLIDEEVKKAFNLKQFKYEDFYLYNDMYYIEKEHSAKYFAVFLAAIISNKMKIFYFVQSYYRWFMRDKELNLFPIHER